MKNIVLIFLFASLHAQSMTFKQALQSSLADTHYVDWKSYQSAEFTSVKLKNNDSWVKIFGKSGKSSAVFMRDISTKPDQIKIPLVSKNQDSIYVNRDDWYYLGSDSLYKIQAKNFVYFPGGENTDVNVDLVQYITVDQVLKKNIDSLKTIVATWDSNDSPHGWSYRQNQYFEPIGQWVDTDTAYVRMQNDWKYGIYRFEVRAYFKNASGSRSYSESAVIVYELAPNPDSNETPDEIELKIPTIPFNLRIVIDE